MKISMRISTLIGALVVLVVACQFPNDSPVEHAADHHHHQPHAPINEHMALAVYWQQHAAEYRALSYQAFNIATERILAMEGTTDRPLAVITDIDETVLDNSPYSGMQVKEDIPFTREDWVEWGKLRSAEGVPGALAFFQLADSMGIEVFYISNRYEEQMDETIDNLEQLGFPHADTNHVFLKTTTSEKQVRRDRVLKAYDVVMLLGDNLSDLTAAFDNHGTSERNGIVDDLKADFGSKFIVLPNPMYGDWESKGLYEGHREWTPAQRDSIRRAKLKSF